MGSDNPKGSVARVSLAMRAAKCLGFAALAVVLLVCLSTAPSTTGTNLGTRRDDAVPKPSAGGAMGAAGVRRAGDGRGAKAFDDGKDDASTASEDLGAAHATAKALPKLSLVSAAAAALVGATKAAPAPAAGMYALHAVDVDGIDTPLAFLTGHVTLVTNVASE
uniref:Uncharacterized protein n=1 Tax=Mantoniella antarctica TaxID=81844 RepID=A0A7S0S9X4_9CHLO|mmetsp:Transcript_14932/g.36725  ORF Transcript_14932/g.36725 Transcript_14932/m.36725 type:complete len:164 (+) Transcript_14932:97-588(+)